MLLLKPGFGCRDWEQMEGHKPSAVGGAMERHCDRQRTFGWLLMKVLDHAVSQAIGFVSSFFVLHGRFC